MEERIEERLFSAIDSDDLRAFDGIAKSVNCGELRLGRFPTLSALYLCNAKKIISAHEEEYLKYTAWKELPEPTALSSRFIEVAGKCLRLYFSDVVTPAEMLMLCGDERRLKRVYPQCRATAATRQKLKTVYSVNFGAEVTFEGENIILARRRLGGRGKKIIIAACAAFLLCAAVGASTPFIVNEFRPFIAAGKTEDGRNIYAVSRLGAIDFGSDKVYRLKKNISVSSSFYAEEVTCTILGNGKTVTVERNAAPFGALYGEMSGVNFKTKGSSPLFETVYAGGNLKDCTVSASVDCTLSSHSSFVARANFGVIDNVTVNASGKIRFEEPQNQVEGDGLVFGGIAAENGIQQLNIVQTSYGNILNCIVNFDGFSAEGESAANATLAGVAGKNSGFINACTVTGDINSSEVDLAGICVENGYAVTGCKNSADLTQVSGSENWNPMVAGIVMTNGYMVQSCVNEGALTSRSTVTQTTLDSLPTVAAAGIAYNNSYSVKSCRNVGDITCEGRAKVYAGGLCALSFYETAGGLSRGKITATGDICYAGGILAWSRPDMTANGNIFLDNTVRCVSECEIAVTSSSPSYAGGVVGYVEERVFYAGTENERVLGGGVSYSYFTGSITSSENSFVGGVVGASGKTLYTENSYTIGTTTYFNFGNNYYSENCGASVGTGAVVTVADDGAHTREAGGDTGAASAPASDIKARADYSAIIAAHNQT